MITKFQKNSQKKNYLSIAELSYFKDVLNNFLDELLYQSSYSVFQMKENPDKEIEWFDSNIIYINLLQGARVQSRKSTLFKKIRAALKRINDGTYGYCQFCGNQISFKRLVARPITSKCLKCEKKEFIGIRVSNN